MKKLIFISIFVISGGAYAGDILLDDAIVTPESVGVEEDELFEKPAKVVKPEKVEEVVKAPAPKPAVVAAPARASSFNRSRMPAAAIVPQRFVDKEMNVACYYLAPADTNGVVAMYAAINCVQLEDPEEKAARAQERRERQMDRAKTENADRSIEAREAYEQNQKELQQLRRKGK